MQRINQLRIRERESGENTMWHNFVAESGNFLPPCMMALRNFLVFFAQQIWHVWLHVRKCRRRDIPCDGRASVQYYIQESGVFI
jgi:hypothetical protein